MPCAKQRLIFAGQPAPGAQRVQAIAITILVHHVREGADLFQAFARRHADAGLGAQPTPIVKTVLSDKVHVGGDVVAQPLVDLFGIEVLCVGMTDREIEPTHLAVSAKSDAYATEVPTAKGPPGTHVSAQPIILRLCVEREDANTAQVGQFGWDLASWTWPAWRRCGEEVTQGFLTVLAAVSKRQLVVHLLRCGRRSHFFQLGWRRLQ